MTRNGWHTPWSQGMTDDWKRKAACLGADPELFFPQAHRLAGRAAKAICATCVVRSDCLEYGLMERFGVWGGLTEHERRRERRRRTMNLTTSSN